MISWINFPFSTHFILFEQVCWKMLLDCTIFIKLTITIEIISKNSIMSTPAIQKVDCYCTEEKCLRGACSSHTCLIGIKNTGRVVRACPEDEDYRMSTESCYRNAEDWSEVCSCGSHLCNSFAFLRSKLIEMDDNAPSHHNQLQPQADTASDMLHFGPDSDAQDSTHTVRMISPAYGIKMPIELAQSLLGNKNNSNKNGFEGFSSFMDENENSPKIDDHSDLDFTNTDSNRRRLLKSSSLLSSDDYSNMIVINRENDQHPTNEKRKNRIVNQSSLILVLIIVPLALGALAISIIIANYYCKMC